MKRNYRSELMQKLDKSSNLKDAQMAHDALQELIPLIRDSEKGENLEEILDYAFRTSYPFVQNVLLDYMTISEDQALYCFRDLAKRRTSDKKIDREFLTRVASYLGDNYEKSMELFLRTFNIGMAEIIAEANDYKDISAHQPLMSIWSDVFADAPDFSPDTVRQFMTLVRKTGADWALQNVDWNVVYLDKRTELNSFEGDLPVIESGILHRPELALAFLNEDVAFRDMFNHVPCWVHENDLDQLPSASSFQWVEGFTVSTGGDRQVLFDLNLSKPGPDMKFGLDTGNILRYGRGWLSSGLKAADFLTFSLLSVKDRLRLGDQPEHHTLALVSVHELKRMEKGAVDPVKMEKASAFSDQFVSLSYILSQHSEIVREGLEVSPGKRGYNMLDLKSERCRFESEPLIEYLSGDMDSLNLALETIKSRSIWEHEASITGKIFPEAMVRLQEKLGFAEEHYDIDKFPPNYINTLDQAGFRFSGKKGIFITSSVYEPSTYEDMVSASIKALDMGAVIKDSPSLDTAIERISKNESPDPRSYVVVLTTDPKKVISACNNDDEVQAVINIVNEYPSDKWSNKDEWFPLLAKRNRQLLLSGDLGL